MVSGDDQVPAEGAEEAGGTKPEGFEKLEARVEKLEDRTGCLWVFAWVAVVLWVLGAIATCAR